MLPYVLPTDQRLQVIEWLFDLCEPGLFQTDDFIDSPNQKLSNLVSAWRQFGIRSSSKIPLEDSVQGTNGLTEAINHLSEITEVVRQLLCFENIENPQLKIENDNKLLNFISSNNSQIFTPQVRLFSPGFLKLDDLEYESESKLTQARDDLATHLENYRKEYQRLEENFEKDLGQNTSNEGFDKLEQTLKNTRERVKFHSFNIFLFRL